MRMHHLALNFGLLSRAHLRGRSSAWDNLNGLRGGGPIDNLSSLLSGFGQIATHFVSRTPTPRCILRRILTVTPIRCATAFTGFGGRN